MKGQMIFQFIIAAVVFFALVFFIITYLNSTVSSFGVNFFNDVLQSKAVEVSELLVHFQGRWVGNEPVIVGLSLEWPVLSSSKIEMLGKYCRESYEELRPKLGLSERYSDLAEERVFNANIKIEGGKGILLDCGPDSPPIRTGSIRRFAVSENRTLLRVEVAVW